MARKPTQPTLTLSELASRIGIAKLAKRLGVTERTAKAWVKSGPSKRYADDVRRYLVKAEGGYKAAESRRERLAERFPTPPEFDEGETSEGIEPEDVLPRVAPETSLEVKRIRKKLFVSGEREPYSTIRFEGFTQWFDVNERAADVELQAIIDSVLYIMDSQTESWVYIHFLFYRYIAFNDNYKDSLYISSQGKWIEWSYKTPARSSSANIAQAIQNIFDGYEKRGADGKLKHVEGAYEVAKKRQLFLGSYQVVVLKNKPSK